MNRIRCFLLFRAMNSSSTVGEGYQVNRVVHACLAKDPADRFQSAHDIAMDLGWMADSAATESAKPSAQFNKSWAAGLAVLLFAFVALAGFGGYRWARSTEQSVSVHAEIPRRTSFLWTPPAMPAACPCFL